MSTKPPLIDLEKMVELIDGTRKKRAAALQELTNEELAQALERAVSLIDVYKTARDAGDDSAEIYLNNARALILGTMGVS